MHRALIALCLAMAAALANAAATDLTSAEQLKVTGSLHGVIQDRLPVTVLIAFAAPEREALLRARDLPALAAYLSDVRRSLLGRLTGDGFTVVKTYDYLPSIAAHISSHAALKRVLADPDVVSVEGDNELSVSLNESIPLIRQPTVIAAGQNGTGSTVAMIDTGISEAQRASSAFIGPRDFSGSGTVIDPIGHGAIVAQIINTTAPGAKIISLKACSSCGDGKLSGAAVQDAINWIYANAEGQKIRAVNLSLSTSSIYQGRCDTALTRLLSDMLLFDVVPVIASGNDGIKNGIAEPACGADVVAVGATYDRDFGYATYQAAGCADQTAAWKVGCFSNSGSMLDIVAPGCRIGAGSFNSIYNCGTSLAAPFVTGAIAIMRGTSVAPELDANGAVTALLSSSWRVTDPANGLVTAALDLPVAVAAAKAQPIGGGQAGTTAAAVVPVVSLLLIG